MKPVGCGPQESVLVRYGSLCSLAILVILWTYFLDHINTHSVWYTGSGEEDNTNVLYTIVQVSKSISATDMTEVRDSFLIIRTRKSEIVFVCSNQNWKRRFNLDLRDWQPCFQWHTAIRLQLSLQRIQSWSLLQVARSDRNSCSNHAPWNAAGAKFDCFSPRAWKPPNSAEITIRIKRRKKAVYCTSHTNQNINRMLNIENTI